VRHVQVQETRRMKDISMKYKLYQCGFVGKDWRVYYDKNRQGVGERSPCIALLPRDAL